MIASLAALACSDAAPESLAQTQRGLIYGEDERRDVYATEDEQLRRLAVESTVAFVSADFLTRNAEGRYDITSPTLGQMNHLCPSEAFVTQPAAATCSGVLVDAQLILTAGHCVSEDSVCDDVLLVFDYAISDPERAPSLGGDAIYRCKSIRARRYGEDRSGRIWDHAFIELDRPVTAERRPVPVSTRQPDIGARLAVIGCPGGLPVKVDAGAEATYRRPDCLDYFAMTSDTFESSSGSGVFDEQGELTGIFVRGGADYEYVPEQRCAVSRRLATPADPSRAEHASTVGAAIGSLCDSGWVSPRLCPPNESERSSNAEIAAMCRPQSAEASSGCATIVPGYRGHHAPALLGTMFAVLMSIRARRQSR